jgi:uncharacterized membrane protein YhaH (DUF805 family)
VHCITGGISFLKKDDVPISASRIAQLLIKIDMDMKEPSLAWLFFSFKGRIARQSFILGSLFLQMIIGWIVYQIVKAGGNQTLLTFWGFVFIVAGAYVLWPALALVVKRLHDIGLPWFFAVAFLVPPFTWILLVVLMIMRGNERANAYGPPPVDYSDPPIS